MTRAILHVTDLARGAVVDLSAVTLEPVLPGFLRLPVPPETKPGDEVYVVLKATVQAIIPG